jgi:hypothetical protein
MDFGRIVPIELERVDKSREKNILGSVSGYRSRGDYD